MEEYEKVYSSDMSAIIKTPINPEFMMWSDSKNKRGWIVIKDTPENIALFDDRFGHLSIPEGYKVYYNEPYYYDLIKDGIDTRHKIEEEKKRQEMLNNPQINLGINSKEELIEYFISELIDNEQSMIWEYSTDFELDEVKLKAKEKELRRLVDKLL
ncbi:hypothetical protein [Staphylococcus phage VB-SauS-SA2]|nr:hypothetical protein [Staphylococcus phage VB-SauS-SA2]